MYISECIFEGFDEFSVTSSNFNVTSSVSPSFGVVVMFSTFRGISSSSLSSSGTLSSPRGNAFRIYFYSNTIQGCSGPWMFEAGGLISGAKVYGVYFISNTIDDSRMTSLTLNFKGKLTGTELYGVNFMTNNLQNTTITTFTTYSSGLIDSTGYARAIEIQRTILTTSWVATLNMHLESDVYSYWWSQ